MQQGLLQWQATVLQQTRTDCSYRAAVLAVHKGRLLRAMDSWQLSSAESVIQAHARSKAEAYWAATHWREAWGLWQQHAKQVDTAVCCCVFLVLLAVWWLVGGVSWCFYLLDGLYGAE